MRAATRLLVVGAAVAASVMAGPSVAKHLRAVRAADRRLLSPMGVLPLPIQVVAPLAKGRTAPASTFPADIAGASITVPATDGRPSVRVVTYEPRERRRPSGALLWIHGGGYVVGDPSMDDDWCARVAREHGALVVSVDYRLAPEHAFPAGLDDCHAALAWVVEKADELGVSRSRIAVGGESAGGGLAAALVQRAYDDGLPVCFQLLTYPMLDDRTVTRAEARGDWALVWSPPSNRYGWTAYLGHAPGEPEHRPYAVPARRSDLTGLPPAWIGVGDVDLFYDEDVTYARRLRAAGVRCDLYEVPGMFHAADRGSTHPGMVAFTGRKLDSLRPYLGQS
jgi:acetyl esterase/lipase